MSIELHVYGYDKTLAKVADLEEALERLGWFFSLSKSVDDPAPSDSLTVTTGVVWGWQRDSAHAASIKQALDANDKQAIQRFFADEELAVVDVIADERFSADPEMAAELEDLQLESKHINTLKNATVCYTVLTSANRNDLSLELQEALWTILGVAIYGLMHDPESDEFTDCARDVIEGNA